MPPLRSTPPAKVAKVERTHAENKERAYIAASRRSDRSLEARCESARRASEIHKERTGRGLKVTQQDVENEEMYEEEDEDLPMQFRRLQAHIKGSASDFSRKLQDYMDAQMAAKHGLIQANTNAYGQPYINQPQFTNSMMAYQPQMPPSGSYAMYPQARQAPYPQRDQHQTMSTQYRPTISVPQPSVLSYNGASMPTGVSPQDTQTGSNLTSRRPSFAHGSFAQFNPQQEQNNPYQQFATGTGTSGGSDYSPFSTDLPGNLRALQSLLAPSMNFNNDPVNSQPTGLNQSQIGLEQIKQESYPSQGMYSTLGHSDSVVKQEAQQEVLDKNQYSNASLEFSDSIKMQEEEEMPTGSPVWDNFLTDIDEWADIPSEAPSYI